MYWILVTIGISLVTVGGDYLIKRSGADPSRPVVWSFLVSGLALYVLTGIGWFFIMKHLKFTSIAVVYGVSTVLFLALLGVFVFQERLSWYEIIGVIMAVSSITLLAKFA